MNSSTLRAVAAMRLVAILGLAGLAACAGKDAGAPPEAAPPPAARPEAPTREQLATATIAGVLPEVVSLANGRYDGPPTAPGGASHPSVTLLEPTILFGDIDGTPPNEAIALLASDGGGSGEFIHLGVFAMRDGKATTIATAPVGDRVQIFRVWLERNQIHMDVVQAAPGEPACCPTQLARKAYGWQDGKLATLEDQPVGSLSINLLGATDWMLVAMDGQPLAEGILPPTALIQYGKVTGFAGCNRYTGPITETRPGTIKVGALAATRKACPGPASDLEGQFLERLGKAESYTFQAGRLLVSGPADKQGVRPALLFSR